MKSSASADYFYDFEPSTLRNLADDEQWVEKTFRLLEQRFKEVLDTFIAEAKTGGVSVDTANEMTHYVAIQWLRTRGARDTLLELNQKTIQKFIDEWYAENHPGMPPGKFTMRAGFAQAFHAQSIFEGDSFLRFMRIVRWDTGIVSVL